MRHTPLLLLASLLACAPAGRASTAPTTTAPAPALAGTSVAGDALDLAALKGRVVLVDFWASWCEPCRRTMPELEALHREHHDAGLTVIGVNIDEQRADLDDFLRARVPVSFPVLHDPKQAIAGRWSPPTMPTLFLVERDGTIGQVFPGEVPGQAEAVRAAVVARLRADGDPRPE